MKLDPKVETFMCENFNRVFVYMLREFLKQTDPKTIRGVSKERMLIQKKPTPTDFQKYSVQRWAISELITAILANPCNSAEDTAYRLALPCFPKGIGGVAETAPPLHRGGL